MAEELLIALNPDPDSRLRYLMRLPLSGGLVFRTSGTWPRTNALYCHPVPLEDWPAEPEVVEQVPLRSCVRRGGAIDLVLARGRENRSQLVFTTARGRQVVFWQTARNRRQARPNVSTPSARAAGITELEIVVDTRERYAYRFANQQARTVSRALPCGDYGVAVGNRTVAAVERKSLADLVSSLLNGTLRYALGELSSLPRAAVVVEDRYSQIFKLERVRPALVADGLAELQVRWPSVPIVFCESRQLAEEYTYRFLAAAWQWASQEHLASVLAGTGDNELAEAPPSPEPNAAELRAWANAAGMAVSDRGRISQDIRDAWRDAQSSPPSPS
ncbi:MAG: histone-like nucleoid-structuring protein Lsr2 [Acidimicrobiales bacterium]